MTQETAIKQPIKEAPAAKADNPYKGYGKKTGGTQYGAGFGGMGWGMMPPPYDLPMDTVDAEGELKGSYGRKADTNNLDIGTLSREAQALATSKNETVQRTEAIIQKFIESENVEPREALHALRELRSLNQESSSVQREAGLYTAENERVMKIAEISATNFADTFLAYTEDKVETTKDDGTVEVKIKKIIDSDASKRNYDKFIRDAMSKGLSREQAVEAIDIAARGYLAKEREVRTGDEGAKQVSAWVGRGYPEGLITDRNKVILKPKNDVMKKAASELLKSGLPVELEKKFRDIRKDNEQRNFYLGIDDGWLGRAFGLDYVMNYDEFRKWAGKYKVFKREDIIGLMKDVLTTYWWDPKAAFTWNASKKEMDHPINNKEELLKMMTESAGLPGEIKDHFRNEYIKVQKGREQFIDEFMESSEVLDMITLADNGREQGIDVNGREIKPGDLKGMTKEEMDALIKEEGSWTYLERRLNDLSSRGLIGNQEYLRALENFDNSLDQGVRFENEMIAFGTGIMGIVQDMIKENSARFTNSEGIDPSERLKGITPEKVWGEIEKMEESGEIVFPRRVSLGGFQRFKFIENFINTEMDRHTKVFDLEYRLNRLDEEKPVQIDYTGRKFDQLLRYGGNFFKTMLGGQSWEQGVDAMRRNWFNYTKGLELDYEQAMMIHDKKRIGLKNQMDALTQASVDNMVDWIGFGYSILRTKDSMEGLRGQISKGRLEAFGGLAPR